MSYDLTFLVPRGTGRIPAGRVQGFFRGRGWYEVSERQAFYSNEDSGVCFSFDYGIESDELEVDDEDWTPPEDGLESAGIAFNLNYMRPHMFGLEAEPEVRALVDHFDLAADDPAA